jgi:hypothetical protein
MDNGIIVAIAVIVFTGIIIAIILVNRKDKKELEEQLNQEFPKKRISDTDEGEKETI